MHISKQDTQQEFGRDTQIPNVMKKGFRQRMMCYIVEQTEQQLPDPLTQQEGKGKARFGGHMPLQGAAVLFLMSIIQAEAGWAMWP